MAELGEFHTENRWCLKLKDEFVSRIRNKQIIERYTKQDIPFCLNKMVSIEGTNSQSPKPNKTEIELPYNR